MSFQRRCPGEVMGRVSYCAGGVIVRGGECLDTILLGVHIYSSICSPNNRCVTVKDICHLSGIYAITTYINIEARCIRVSHVKYTYYVPFKNKVCVRHKRTYVFQSSDGTRRGAARDHSRPINKILHHFEMKLSPC